MMEEEGILRVRNENLTLRHGKVKIWDRQKKKTENKGQGERGKKKQAKTGQN